MALLACLVPPPLSLHHHGSFQIVVPTGVLPISFLVACPQVQLHPDLVHSPDLSKEESSLADHCWAKASSQYSLLVGPINTPDC